MGDNLLNDKSPFQQLQETSFHKFYPIRIFAHGQRPDPTAKNKVVPQDIEVPQDMDAGEEIVYDSMDPEAPVVFARVCERGCACVRCAHYVLHSRARAHIVTCAYTYAHTQNTHVTHTCTVKIDTFPLEREKERFIRNNLHNGVVSGAAR